MKRIIIVMILLLIPVFSFAENVKDANKLQTLQKNKRFEILSQHNMSGRGFRLVVLVSPSTSKDQAMALAKELRDLYKDLNPKKILDISIFDSKEAYKHQSDDKYPQKKFMKHYLVQVNVNPNTGFNEIRWVAEGRK